MTLGQKTNLHHIPYDGNIETHIDEARANQLLINETADVSRTLTAQVQRMVDAGIEGFRYALPTANGVMVNCDNPQQAYDAIYGSMEAPAAKSSVSSFKPFSTVALNAAFSGVAQNDNGISRAPAVHSAFDRATKAPALGGLGLDMPALAA